MDQATILEWRVAHGEEVGRGDIVALIDTEKSEIEVESWQSGVVDSFLAEVGDVVDVGTPILAFVGADVTGRVGGGEPVVAAGAAAVPAVGADVESPPADVTNEGSTVPGPAVTPDSRRSPAAPSPLVRRLAEQHHLDIGRIHGTGPGGRVMRHDVESAATPRAGRASPRARRLAAERGMDLSAVVGTGPGGAVLAADLETAASEPRESTRAGEAPTPAGDKGAAMRHAVAAIMERSNREIPHYHLAVDIDLGRALEWLAARNAERPPSERVLPAALLMKATALAAAAHGELNGFWVDGSFVPSHEVNLGVAVSLRGGGLLAPAIHDADRLDVAELMARLRDLVARTRAGRLRSSEMSDPTITVTNLGDRGPDLVHGVIYAPQVALVGFGRVRERPVVVEGVVVARPVVTATLAADHRATDGDRGARLLASVARNLEQPEEL
jgi:pyruvate dehydrogenase E2 component (dihydrolipoamide acetyltransferase)